MWFEIIAVRFVQFECALHHDCWVVAKDIFGIACNIIINEGKSSCIRPQNKRYPVQADTYRTSTPNTHAHIVRTARRTNGVQREMRDKENEWERKAPHTDREHNANARAYSEWWRVVAAIRTQPTNPHTDRVSRGTSVWYTLICCMFLHILHTVMFF